MEYTDTMKLLPSGMYKSYLIDRLFRQYRFESPVLEIGCGTGEFLEAMKQYNLSGEIFDVNEEIIEHCKKKCQAIDLSMKIQIADLFNYHSQKKFSTIFMFEILEHIENDQGALNKVYNLLTENGYYVMSVPGKQFLFSDEDEFQGHLRRYEREELQNKLKNSGFKIEIFWCYNPLPYVSKYILRKKEIKKESIEKRTKDSSHVIYPAKKKLIDILYPMYSRLQFLLKIQNMFLNTDFGAHYLVLCRK